MTADFDRDELIRLMDRLTTGEIESVEQERLATLLESSPEARKAYFTFIDLDMGLRDMAAGSAAQAPPAVGLGLTPPADVSSARPRSTAGFFGYAVTATVAILATAVLFFVFLHLPEDVGKRQNAPGTTSAVPERKQSPSLQDRTRSDCVATLLFADECRWETEDSRLIEGQRLPIGELHLRKGLALLRFDGGAIALITGDTQLLLESRGSLRLQYGRLTARASGEAVGFTVRTPASNVVDLGTEFTVEVERSGATEVHVLEGMVEFRDPTKNAGSGQRLKGGQAVRFDEAHAMKPKPVAMNAKPLDKILREAKPKPREDLLVVYEGFQYDTGPLALENASGGWGWREHWRRRRATERSNREPDSLQDMQIAFQKLRVPWPIRGGRAGMLEMSPGNQFLLRPLEEPVDLSKDRVYYISMMMREDLETKENNSPGQSESARLTLRSSKDYWGDRVCFGLPKHRTPHIELADFIRFTGPEVPGGQTMIWVAKIAAKQHGEDEIFFRVYQEGDSLDIFEPADWNIASRGVRSDASLDLLLLSSTGQTRRWFDEIRIGTSWRAVIPIAQPTKVSAEMDVLPAGQAPDLTKQKQ